MRSFTYTIKDEIGIHARPAGILAKKAKEYQSEILLECNNKTVNLTKLMALMGLGVKCGDQVIVTVTGPDETDAVTAIEEFFSKNL